MCQIISPKNEATRLKDDLLSLLQEIIPGRPTPEEIAVFMQTGVIPPTWWGEMFNHDVSSEQLKKIRNLMEFIQDDFSYESPEETEAIDLIEEAVVPPVEAEKNDGSDDIIILPMEISSTVSADAPLEQLENQLEVNQQLLANTLPPIVEEKILPKVTEKVIPRQHPKKPKQSFERPRPKSGFPKKVFLPEKTKLTEKELANILFSKFINSTLDGKRLNLTKLRALVEQNLIGHTVGHNSQDKILTLYDNVNNPATTFSAKGLEVESI